MLTTPLREDEPFPAAATGRVGIAVAACLRLRHEPAKLVAREDGVELPDLAIDHLEGCRSKDAEDLAAVAIAVDLVALPDQGLAGQDLDAEGSRL